MISTISIFALIYLYSIFKILKKSGSLRKFNPVTSGRLIFSIFVTGSTIIILLLIFTYFKLLCDGIIP
jgi:hypothetical protein